MSPAVEYAVGAGATALALLALGFLVYGAGKVARSHRRRHNPGGD